MFIQICFLQLINSSSLRIKAVKLQIQRARSTYTNHPQIFFPALHWRSTSDVQLPANHVQTYVTEMMTASRYPDVSIEKCEEASVPVSGS